jgi:hypothetical protein
MVDAAGQVTTFDFPAVWRWCNDDHRAPKWRKLGVTPGSLTLTPGRAFRVELAAGAAAEDFASVLALAGPLPVREVHVGHGDGFAACLAALPQTEYARAGCHSERDEQGRHVWEVQLRQQDWDWTVEPLVLWLKHWPGEEVAAAIGSVPGLNRLEWLGWYQEEAFDIRPLFRLPALRTFYFSVSFLKEVECDWTGLSGLGELRELTVDHGSYNARFWHEVAALPRLERLCLHWVEKAECDPRTFAESRRLKELAVDCPQLLPRRFWDELGRLSVEKFAVESGSRDEAMAAGFASLRDVEARSFNLSCTDRTLRSLLSLRGMRSLVLREVSSSETKITQAGFQELGNLAELESLEIQGFEAVAPAGWRALRRLGRLRRLNVRSGTPFDFLAEIGPLPTVEELDLAHCNPLSPAGWSVLEKMPSLRSLRVEAWVGPYYRPFTEMGRATRLRVLDLYVGETTDAELAAIEPLRDLEEFALGVAKVTDAGLARLKGFPLLRKVRLCGLPKLTDQGLAELASIPNLRELEVSLPKGVSEAGCAVLERAVKLEILSLRGKQLTDDRVHALAMALPLRQVTLQDSPLLSDKVLLRLAEHPTLRKVRLNGCRNVTGAGKAALRAARPDWEV